MVTWTKWATSHGIGIDISHNRGGAIIEISEDCFRNLTTYFLARDLGKIRESEAGLGHLNSTCVCVNLFLGDTVSPQVLYNPQPDFVNCRFFEPLEMVQTDDERQSSLFNKVQLLLL